MTSEQESAEVPRVELSAEVVESWRRFKKFYKDNQVVIENRWIKMTKAKRMDLLAKSWRSSGESEMPRGHRPDLTEYVPWRSADKTRNLLPLLPVNENYLRWPTFNQDDLVNAKEAFLQLLYSRAKDHPKDFAHLDYFRENEMVAELESINFILNDSDSLDFDTQPMARIHTIRSDEEGEDVYGSLARPSNQEEMLSLIMSRLWPISNARSMLVNQHRIYKFLENVVTDIMAVENEAKYKCAGEDVKTQWLPLIPSEPIVADDLPRWEEQRNDYLIRARASLPYTSMTEDKMEYVIEVCYRQVEWYWNKIQRLKGHPKGFYEFLYDIHEHSHHMVMYTGDRIHPWADLDDNEDNARMWATHLIHALYTLTEGLDAWIRIIAVIKGLQDLTESEEGSDVWIYQTIILYNLLFDRQRLYDLRTTLACSKPVRKYFRNTKLDYDAEPILETGLQGFPEVPPKEARVASLVSLLRVMTEEKADTVISHKTDTWASEIFTIIRNERGGSCMTNYGTEKAQESLDAATAWLCFKRVWDFHDHDRLCKPDPEDETQRYWKEYRQPSDRLRAIDPMSQDFINIVKRHMLPSPQKRFDYPNVTQSQKAARRQRNIDTRRASESNLKALWAELQPMLESKGALSVNSIYYLNQTVPIATAEDGSDVTPQEPPNPPQAPESGEPAGPSTPPQPPGPNSPHTPPGPPGPPGSAAPVTPTGPLQGLSIKSPANRPPPVRTPERKTANDGVKKISPIRRARPDEDRPRRPQIDRRVRRQALEAAAARPARAFVAPPTAAPPADREYPQIELPADSYEVARLLMTTDRNRRPGTLAWNDLQKLIRDCGFVTVDRGGGGGAQVFAPSDDLRDFHGITTSMSRDRPHGANAHLPFQIARGFIRGGYGFGKYGWTFDKFKQAGT